MDDAKQPRRDFLFLATGAFAAIGVVAVAKPMLAHLAPAADSLHMPSLEVDLSKIEEGVQVVVTYRGRPVAIRHRTPAEIKAAQDDDQADMIQPETDQERLRPKPDGTYDSRFLVLYPKCTHMGMFVVGELGDFNGWACPSHGGQFDTSGRSRKGPAPRNLDVPDYFWLSDTSIILREKTALGRLQAKQL